MAIALVAMFSLNNLSVGELTTFAGTSLRDVGYVSSEELQQCKSDKIRVTSDLLEDKAINRDSDDKETPKFSTTFSRYFKVKRSSVREVNGRYYSYRLIFYRISTLLTQVYK